MPSATVPRLSPGTANVGPSCVGLGDRCTPSACTAMPMRGTFAIASCLQQLVEAEMRTDHERAVAHRESTTVSAPPWPSCSHNSKAVSVPSQEVGL